jgi:poly(3-hydroxybutyrate) depolymerase
MNPQGCWDWWGYNGADYAVKSAPQMTAIMAMVSRITSGRK